MDLIKLNKLAALAHLLSFVGVLVAYVAWPNTHRYAIAQTYRYTLPDEDQLGPGKCNSDNSVTQGSGRCTINYAYAPPAKTVRFNVIFGVLFFFAFTACAHMFYATDGFQSGRYTRALQEGWNPYRWFEYAISASVMSILIGYALGTHDMASLFMFAIITAAMQACGFVVEAALRTRSRLSNDIVNGASIAGWLLFVGLWAPLITTFAYLVYDVRHKYNDVIDPDTNKPLEVPLWVWFIVIFQLIQYAMFGLVQRGQIKNPGNYLLVEKKYIMLSFIAKLGLAGGLGYGLLWRTRECPA